jgi:hypothetical protein
MTNNQLFAAALGITVPWFVQAVASMPGSADSKEALKYATTIFWRRI